MIPTRTIRIIEISWSGPHSPSEVAALCSDADRGLLAFYGTHPVFGADALLYLDEAREAAFAQRLERVGAWTRYLPTEPQLYIGRLGGPTQVSPEEHLEAIRVAHRLLCFFHSPPWNSREIDHHQISELTAVLNLGHRHRLALEVSNLWDLSAWEPGSEKWSFWPADEPAADGPVIVDAEIVEDDVAD